MQKAAGCVVGQDYPKPIVDHDVVHKKNITRMKEVSVFGLFFWPSYNVVLNASVAVPKYFFLLKHLLNLTASMRTYHTITDMHVGISYACH